jgi:hypothetical protein
MATILAGGATARVDTRDDTSGSRPRTPDNVPTRTFRVGDAPSVMT